MSSPVSCNSCGSVTHKTATCWADDDWLEPIVPVKTVCAAATTTRKVWSGETFAKVTCANLPKPVETKSVKPVETDDDGGFTVVVTKKKVRGGDIKCKTCGEFFVFDDKTRAKYAERGWCAPKVCKICSQKRYENGA